MTLLRNILLTAALLTPATALAQTSTTATPATTGTTTTPSTSGTSDTAGTTSGTMTKDRGFDYGWLGLLGLLGLAGLRRQMPTVVVPNRPAPTGTPRP